MRQLNMYGFHKVPHLQQGVLLVDGEVDTSWEFVHDYFQRDRVDLLPLVKRKVAEEKEKDKETLGTELPVSSSNSSFSSNNMLTSNPIFSAHPNFTSDVPYSLTDGTVRPLALHSVSTNTVPQPAHLDGAVGLYSGGESSYITYPWNTPSSVPLPPTNNATTTPYYSEISYLVNELSQIRHQQEHISQTLAQIEQEHSSMYHEMLSLRERYQNQQETIDKILRFLASIFTSAASLGAAGSSSTQGISLADLQGLVEVLRKSAGSLSGTTMSNAIPPTSTVPTSPWLASALDPQHPLRKRRLLTLPSDPDHLDSSRFSANGLLNDARDPMLFSPPSPILATSITEPSQPGATLEQHGRVSPTTQLKTAKLAAEHLHNDIDALQLDLEELSHSLGFADDAVVQPFLKDL